MGGGDFENFGVTITFHTSFDFSPLFPENDFLVDGATKSGNGDGSERGLWLGEGSLFFKVVNPSDKDFTIRFARAHSRERFGPSFKFGPCAFKSRGELLVRGREDVV